MAPRALVVRAQIQTTASVLGLAPFENGVERRGVEVSDGSPWTARGVREGWDTHLFPPANEVDDELDDIFLEDANADAREAARTIYGSRVIFDFQFYPLYAGALAFGAVTAPLKIERAPGDELRGFETPSRVARTAKSPRLALWTVLGVGVVVVLLTLLFRKTLIRTNCPSVDTDVFRVSAASHQTCTR